MDSYKLQQLCIKNNWFTSGTNAQYDKLFDMRESGKFSIHEMALVIWCCTPDVEIVDIEIALEQAGM